MLSFALKLVWFVLCIIGTVISWVVLVAFGSLLGSRWVPMSFCIALTVLEGMFCLGMIWRMDPFRMPRSFCVAQAILIHVSTYVLTGLSMAFCIATNFHILRPKTWANLEQCVFPLFPLRTNTRARSLRWRRVYIIPVIVYPATISVVQITLNLHFNAIQPTDEMHCDASVAVGASCHYIHPSLPLRGPSLPVCRAQAAFSALRH
ncbi:hypothetical protein B0H15DRAFT_774172 [Mycena belliarum]|uniref:Uncharacterized protein n=1 Tax=Mycena belliarum TaxID=1033014 RepID=A0AAD6UC70_9AGAR|nr:hypothetical protein B0H15DRAFT_774172 [Mycena belliae]